MKTKDQPKKQTGNKAETKLPILLKTKEWPEKQTGNKPENKAGQLVENQESVKIKPETNRKTDGSMTSLSLARMAPHLPSSLAPWRNSFFITASRPESEGSVPQAAGSLQDSSLLLPAPARHRVGCFNQFLG